MPPRLIRSLARRTPPIVRERLLRLAYRATRDLRFLVVQADDLARLGRRKEALAAYQAVLDAVAANPFVVDRQALQFAAARGRHQLGADEVADPLFSMRLEAEPNQPQLARGRLEGHCTVRLSYMGLRIAGRLDRAALDRAGVDAVEVRIGEHLVRRVNVAHGPRGAAFGLLVRRPALATFPARALLSVRPLLRDATLGPPLPIAGGTSVACVVPFGDDSVSERVGGGSLVDKKGRLRRTSAEVSAQQGALLALYARASSSFERLFGRPLFLLYGTLLGLHRDGDFIPGDDDFDVGYVSHETSPEAVKVEVLDIMRRLVREGYEIGVNRKGKPFRLRAPGEGVDLHLDARPVWYQDGRVLAHKQASLELPFDAFTTVRRVPFRAVEAVIPDGTEAFLEAYYGKGWRVPDPGYSNDAMVVPPTVKATLDRVCLQPRDVERLRLGLEDEVGGGRFFAVAYHDLYPLDVYERRIGW